MELSYITVGVVVNTHGLRGEVRVMSRTERPEKRFAPGSQLKLRQSHGQPERELKVSSSRKHKQFWLVTFDGISTIEAAEKLKGFELCVDAKDLVPLDEGAYYIHQLIGLNVMSDEGTPLGILKEVLTPGANDVYVVRRHGKKDLLIPAIKDCILDVNLDKSTITVRLIPGLDENED